MGARTIIESFQLIWIAKQLNLFSMVWAVTGYNYRKDYNLHIIFVFCLFVGLFHESCMRVDLY